jgi:hypothetical protein
MSEAQKLTRIIAENDQDLAAAKEWMAGHHEDELIVFWEFVQGVSESSDPKIAVMARLAALKFAELVISKGGA